MTVPLIGQSKPEEPKIIEAETAFLVFIAKDENGVPRTLLSTDINVPVTPDHTASMDEVLGAMSVVSSDILAGKTSDAMMMRQAMAMRQAQEARANQQLLENLGNNGQPARR
jgi:hypothetical protein